MFSRLLQRWEVSTSSGSHFQVLDGLRGVAILLVVAHHALYTNPDYGIIAKLFNWGIIQAGWMGVPIFFVLSGFLISYPFFQKRESNPQFWYQRGYARRRLAKILPPFYLSIIFFMFFYWWNYHDPAYFSAAWKWALWLGNFTPISPTFNGVYWSLMIETQFYIILPLLFWLTRGLSPQKTGVLIFSVLLLVPLIVRHAAWPEKMYVLPEYTHELFGQVWFKIARFPGYMDFFAWGVIFAALFVPLQKNIGLEKLRPLSVLGYVGVVLMGITLVYWGLWEDQFDIRVHNTQWSIEVSHFLPTVATLLLLFFIFDPESYGSRFLRMGWLRFAGVISYEWFLFHNPLVHWLPEHYPVHTQGNLLLYLARNLGPPLLTFIFAALVYRYFSLPVLKRVRDSLQKTKAN